MKEVMAVLRINMIGKTKKALEDAGISSFMAKNCLGRGVGLIDYKALKGAELGYDEAIEQLGAGQRLISKRFISVVVPDDLVETTVKTIIAANQTGNPGDGKVFVLPIMNSIRIRTGEEGPATLD
jgi:nitrogen regulatory protein PII 2